MKKELKVVSFEQFGRRLAEARKRLGMRGEDLAAAAGIQQSNLSRWERGKSEPMLVPALRAALALGLLPNEACLTVPPTEIAAKHSGETMSLSAEEAEIIGKLRELERAMPDQSPSPTEVYLAQVRNNHDLILGALESHAQKSKMQVKKQAKRGMRK